LTADYYQIEVRKQISTVGAGTYLFRCFNQPVQDPTACARIIRDPNTGQISAVNTGRENSSDIGGPFATRGLDVGVNWTIPFDELFGGEGRLRLANAFLWVIDYGSGGFDNTGLVVNGLGGIFPEFANTFTAAVDFRQVTVQVRHAYESGSALFTSNAALLGMRVPDYHNVELSARFSVNENFEMTLTVQDLLDELPPQTLFSEQNGSFPYFYGGNLLGRSFIASAKVKF
jgi:hypothetical protein